MPVICCNLSCICDDVIMSRKFNSIFSVGIAFTNDGKYMAVAERRNYKDFVSVYACDTWVMEKVRELHRLFEQGIYFLQDVCKLFATNCGM